MKLLTTEEERKIKMKRGRKVSAREKMIFPLVAALVIILLVPASAPLIAMFMLGNLFRESKVVERLNDTAQNSLMNIVTIFLGISVGATMSAENFLRKEVIFIFCLGLFAFMLVGAAGVSAVPMAARVVQKVGAQANKKNYLLMFAMGPNIAGVIGTVIAAGIFLTMLK
jgi:oxaloacetate decarboxylase beta subunit